MFGNAARLTVRSVPRSGHNSRFRRVPGHISDGARIASTISVSASILRCSRRRALAPSRPAASLRRTFGRGGVRGCHVGLVGIERCGFRAIEHLDHSSVEAPDVDLAICTTGVDVLLTRRRGGTEVAPNERLKDRMSTCMILHQRTVSPRTKLRAIEARRESRSHSR